MSRRAAVVAIAVVLIAAGAWWRFGRERDEPTAAATAPDAGTARVARAAPPPPPAVDLPVTEERDPAGDLRLEGQVVDVDGHGVGAAEVRLLSNPPRTATTEGDGSFAFDGLIARDYTLVATQGDRTGSAQVTLRADTPPVIVRLRAGARVSIRVVAADTGAPIAGADVELGGAREMTSATDRDGVARFRGVPGGVNTARATAGGYAPAAIALVVPEGASEPIERTIELRRGAPVAGRVVDEAGAPIAGARVGPIEAGSLTGALDAIAHEGAKTDDAGAFRIPAVAAGTYRFVAVHDGYPPAASEPVTVDGRTERTGVVIQLARGARVAGRVVTADGQPAAHATVRLVARDASTWTAIPGSGAHQAIADDQGRFTFDAVARVPVVLVASGDAATSEAVDVDLTGKDAVEDVVLTLSIDGVIAGIVVDGDGAPVAEVYVTALPDVFDGEVSMAELALRGPHTAMTGGDGRFALRGVPPGSYRVRATRGAPLSIELFGTAGGVRAKPGDTDVRVVLEAEGGVTGRVQLPDGSAPDAFTVAVGAGTLRPGGRDGRFEVDGIPGGTYDVTFRGPEFAPTTVRDVTIRGGEITDLGVISLRRGRSVRGRVLGPDGAPVAGATVLFGRQVLSDGTKLGAGLAEMFAEQMGLKRATSGPDGAYRIAGIPPTAGEIAAEHPDVGRSRHVSVPAGDGDIAIDLPLLPFGRVEGAVTLGGQPASGAVVLIGQPGSQSPLIVTTDEKGAYLVERLPAGDYSFTAMKQSGLTGGQSASTHASVAAGEVARVDIDIPVGTITLTVSIRGEGDAPIETAQVFVAEGKWDLHTAKEVNLAFFGGTAASARHGFATGGREVVFRQMRPGDYSVCAIPIAGDLNDPNVAARIQQVVDQLPVYCKSFAIADGPDQQRVEIVVPPPGPLPSPDDAPAP
ncbi:MAG: hypothetical protein D6689_19905 [Deltaproteobacteria bacterium]|nr:MAG: hypothetical protein D6689_19905 [Deltaproteobacteria bacterium]